MEVRSELQVEGAAYAHLADVRALIRTESAEFGLTQGQVDDLVQAVDEMVTNVLAHGYGGQPGPVEILVWSEDDALVVRIRDEAPEFDPTAWARPRDRDRPESWRAGGFGIELTRRFVDSFRHRRRDDGPPGNELTLLKRRPQEGRLTA